MHPQKKLSFQRLIILILIAGSIWGLSEVAGNSLIKHFGLPLRAAILTGIAFTVMGFMGGYLKKAQYILLILVPAILIVQMGVVLCGTPVACKTNTCVALILHAGFLSVLFHATGSGRKKTGAAKTFFLGSTAAFSSAIAFYFIGMRCAPCPYLLSFNSSAGFVSYLYAEALPWTIFAGAGFSAGYSLGNRKSESPEFLSMNLKIPEFIQGLALSLGCWIISGLIIIGQ
ncbi:MAG TPA: hypothetical protein PK358_00655 [Spirochaetota bacterium]|nr:hypothetical protein [Spirochaetota bacterium]HPJ33312.1 hypothetical protein [Spirochaetota bacterium]